MASGALQKIVVEMDQRYDLFSKKGVKKITEYNEWVENADDRYSLEVVGVLVGSEIQPIRSFRHFYGTVSMGADNTLSFSLENDGRLGMTFNVYKYDTDLNPGNA